MKNNEWVWDTIDIGLTNPPQAPSTTKKPQLNNRIKI